MEVDQVVETNQNKLDAELRSTSFEHGTSPKSHVTGFHMFEEDML